MQLKAYWRLIQYVFEFDMSKSNCLFHNIGNKYILANVHLTSHFVNKLYEKQIEKTRTDN